MSNNSWCLTGMPTLTHPLQHISGKDHNRCLKDHEGKVSIGGRAKTNLCFADDIDGLAGEEEELAKLVESRQSLHNLQHGDQCQEDQADDNTSGINTEIKINGQKLETVTSFKYLCSVITDEGSKPKILSKIAQITAALTRLKPVWNDRNVMLSSKIQLMCSSRQLDHTKTS